MKNKTLISVTLEDSSIDGETKTYQISPDNLEYLVGVPLADYLKAHQRTEEPSKIKVTLEMQIIEKSEYELQEDAMDRLEDMHDIAMRRAEEGIATSED